MSNKTIFTSILLTVIGAYSLWLYLKPYPRNMILTEKQPQSVGENPTPRCIRQYFIELRQFFSFLLGQYLLIIKFRKKECLPVF